MSRQRRGGECDDQTAWVVRAGLGRGGVVGVGREQVAWEEGGQQMRAGRVEVEQGRVLGRGE